MAGDPRRRLLSGSWRRWALAPSAVDTPRMCDGGDDPTARPGPGSRGTRRGLSLSAGCSCGPALGVCGADAEGMGVWDVGAGRLDRDWLSAGWGGA